MKEELQNKILEYFLYLNGEKSNTRYLSYVSGYGDDWDRLEKLNNMSSISVGYILYYPIKRKYEILTYDAGSKVDDEKIEDFIYDEEIELIVLEKIVEEIEREANNFIKEKLLNKFESFKKQELDKIKTLIRGKN